MRHGPRSGDAEGSVMRLTLTCRIDQCQPRRATCPLSANSGRMHCSKRRSYSIVGASDAIYFGSDFTSFAICRQVSSST